MPHHTLPAPAPGDDGRIHVLLLGHHGAGKGEQASRLCRALGVDHLSTGDLLRRAVAQRTELGRSVAPMLERGVLVPDALLLEVVREGLAACGSPTGVVLDGFPRTLAQAEQLNELLGREVDLALHLRVPAEVAAQRMAFRGRADDEPEAIERRVRRHEETIDALLGRYERAGVLAEVDGTGSPADIAGSVRQLVAPLVARVAA